MSRLQRQAGENTQRSATNRLVGQKIKDFDDVIAKFGIVVGVVRAKQIPASMGKRANTDHALARPDCCANGSRTTPTAITRTHACTQQHARTCTNVEAHVHRCTTFRAFIGTGTPRRNEVTDLHFFEGGRVVESMDVRNFRSVHGSVRESVQPINQYSTPAICSRR